MSPQVPGHMHTLSVGQALSRTPWLLWQPLFLNTLSATCILFSPQKSSVIFSSKFHPQIVQGLSAPFHVYWAFSNVWHSHISPLFGDEGTMEKWNVHFRWLLEFLTDGKFQWFHFTTFASTALLLIVVLIMFNETESSQMSRKSKQRRPRIIHEFRLFLSHHDAFSLIQMNMGAHTDEITA